MTSTLGGIGIDPINGYLYLDISLQNRTTSTPSSLVSFLMRIEGLPRLLDIIPTFQPAAGTLSWVTPKHPEALPAADRFMVFGGSIDTTGTMSVPVPLECNVPTAGNPQPGDYLSIMDTRPDPPPGEASYVIIAYSGQRDHLVRGR